MTKDVKKENQLTNEISDLLVQQAQNRMRINQLNKEVSKLNIAFQSIGDGVIIVDRDCTIVLFNLVAEQLTGWSIQDAHGTSLDEIFRLINDESNQPCENPAAKVMETGESLGLVKGTMLISRDRTKRYISASCAPIFNDRNKCDGAVLVFRDISKIKKAEESVIESEIKYRSIVENSQDLIYEVNAQGLVLYVNPPCKKILGFEQSELVGKSAFDLIHPDDLPHILTAFNRAIKNMPTEIVTCRAKDKNSQYHWLECTGNPFFAKNGEIRVVIISRDITDRRETEDALAHSEALFRATFEKSPIGKALVNLDGHPITINTALQKMLGYSGEEIKSKVLTEFTHPEDASKDWALFQELIEGKIEHYEMEKRYFHKNGQIVHGLLNVSMINSLLGSPAFVIASVVDITERILIEQELTTLNKLMQTIHRFIGLEEVYNVALDTLALIENVDMAMIYTVDEEKKEALLQAHRNVPEHYIKRATTIPYPKGITWKVINTGIVMNVEDAQKDPNIGPAGRELGHHSFLGIPINLDHKVIGVIWFLSYKERKFSEKEVMYLTTLGDQIAIAVAKAKMLREIERTQEQLIQSEKLASIGQLISSIAHEINNPLTPIIGYSQRLLDNRTLNKKEKNSIEIIYNSAQRVYKIIEKLLSFSRKYLPVRSYEDINILIEQSIEFREFQLNLENIKIIRDLDPNLPPTMIDPNQIQQVFINILLNAEQAIIESHGSGTIEIKTRLKNDNCIEVSLSDDGPGIPQEIKGKVFDPFFTTKAPGKGTGLGLSVGYGIIKEHGGEIHFSNNDHEGVTFTIDLPVLTPTVYSSSSDNLATEGKLMKLMNKRVLIVEDEVMIVSLIKSVLEETGNTVDIATNGKEAIDRIDLKQYDLIICDIKMPEISGVQLYNEVQKTNPELISKFIFITGDPSDQTMDFLVKVGNPYLVKPFKIDKFRAQINDMLMNISTN